LELSILQLIGFLKYGLEISQGVQSEKLGKIVNFSGTVSKKSVFSFEP